MATSIVEAIATVDRAINSTRTHLFDRYVPSWRNSNPRSRRLWGLRGAGDSRTRRFDLFCENEKKLVI